MSHFLIDIEDEVGRRRLGEKVGGIYWVRLLSNYIEFTADLVARMVVGSGEADHARLSAASGLTLSDT